MSQQNNKITHLLISLLVSLIMVTAACFIYLNRRLVIDQINVWMYEPSSEIVSLATQSGMNDYGRFLFLASQPLLAESSGEVSTFNSVCSNVEQTVSILGCYNDYKIYLYNVTDNKLDGVRETTAAHETLHAAYLRLSGSEEAIVDKLLEAEAEKLGSNASFTERMAYYKKNEPGQFDNELHSVIGTEVADISPKLEAYYKKYFSDRQKVVTLNAKYVSVFQELTNKAKSLIAQLKTLSEEITNESSQYNSDVVALNNAIMMFNNNANSGNFRSQAEFNARRSSLVSQAAALNQSRVDINDKISNYSSLLEEYNSIASESKKLSNSLNSNLSPAPSM